MGEAVAAVGAFLGGIQYAAADVLIPHVQVLLFAGVLPLDVFHQAAAAGLHHRLEENGLVDADEIQGAVPPALGQMDDGGLGDDHLFHGVVGGTHVEMDLRVPGGEHVRQLGAQEDQILVLPVEMGLRLQPDGLQEDLEAQVNARAGHIGVAPEIGLGREDPVAPMGLLGDEFIEQFFEFFLHVAAPSCMVHYPYPIGTPCRAERAPALWILCTKTARFSL